MDKKDQEIYKKFTSKILLNLSGKSFIHGRAYKECLEAFQE